MITLYYYAVEDDCDYSGVLSEGHEVQFLRPGAVKLERSEYKAWIV